MESLEAFESKKGTYPTDLALIVDRDGTLASVAWCAPTTKNNDDWAAYNAALPFDAVVPSVAWLLRSAKLSAAAAGKHLTIIMVSGRMEGDHPGDRRRRFKLQDWIAKYDLPIDILMMRAGGDLRIDSEVKEEMYLTKIKPYYWVGLVIDDRPQVCDMWRRHGLNLRQVKDPGLPPPIACQVVHEPPWYDIVPAEPVVNMGEWHSDTS